MTVTNVDQQSTVLRRSGLKSVIASEAIKIWTLRFPRVLVTLAVVLAAVTALLFLLTIDVTQGDSLAALLWADIASTALLGVDATAVVFIILGAWFVASEYATGMMRTTLVATPNRVKVFSAKLLVLAGAAVLAGLVSVLLAILVAQLVLAVSGLPVLNLMDGELLRMALGSLLIVPFYSVLVAALAFIVRTTGGAVTATLAVMFAPAVVSMLPNAAQQFLLPMFPNAAILSISGSTDPGQAVHLVPLLAVVVLACWLVVVLGAALTLFSRRDA
ncbi:MAG: hypothetical protein HLX51_04970 [Micrococcaceae bacterium]|nr:hypothetical protein [Micrococcaceae bacterium]